MHMCTYLNLCAPEYIHQCHRSISILNILSVWYERLILSIYSFYMNKLYCVISIHLSINVNFLILILFLPVFNIYLFHNSPHFCVSFFFPMSSTLCFYLFFSHWLFKSVSSIYLSLYLSIYLSMSISLCLYLFSSFKIISIWLECLKPKQLWAKKIIMIK